MAGGLAVLCVVPLAAIAVLLTVELGAECFVRACDGIDRLAARGVIGLVGALVFCVVGAIRGTQLLLHAGRSRLLVVSVAAGIGFGELGWGGLGSAHSSQPDVPGAAIVASGVLPLMLLALPGVRRWTSSITRDEPPRPIGWPDKRLALWDGRLSEPTMTAVTRANLWLLPMFYSAVVLPGLLVLVAEYGAAGGILGGLVIATFFAGGLVMHAREIGRARDLVAREHGLPSGSCRGVLFGDPAIFDATLRGAIRSAGVPPRPDVEPPSPLRQT